MFDRRLIQYFDWWLFFLTAVIVGYGLLTLQSAVSAGGPAPERILAFKQMIWYGVGFFCMFIAFLLDYKRLEKLTYLFYWVCMGLLIWLLLFGTYIAGSRRWIQIGGISLQPSELAKLAVILVLAKLYAKLVTTEGLDFRDLIWPLIMTAIPFGLIVKQPDLGTAMLILLIGVSITMFVKIERRTFYVLLATGIASVPMVWFILKDYQRQRILTFINPDGDPLGTGYHIIQSKIAIGSGQVFGKGHLQGTQNALAFLPEQHTDFIFSVMAEERGFVGAGFLILLFFLLILWGLNIAYSTKDPFGMILCFGITSMFFWQAFINIGMVMGLLPVVGVTLPFISYGGSSVITVMIGTGLLLNVSVRRHLVE